MIKTKICTKCKKRKYLSTFCIDKRNNDQHQSQCKQCHSLSCRKYYLKNKKTEKQRVQQWQKQNPVKFKRTIKKYQHKIQPHLAKNLRIRVHRALKRISKTGHTLELLGCSISQLIKHLEEQFKKGMTWKNYGKWHVDHIKPLSSFDLTNPKQQKLACNYKNLQPLWAKENLRKSNN